LSILNVYDDEHKDDSKYLVLAGLVIILTVSTFLYIRFHNMPPLNSVYVVTDTIVYRTDAFSMNVLVKKTTSISNGTLDFWYFTFLGQTKYNYGAKKTLNETTESWEDYQLGK
jgi:hypothetical protein